MWICKYNHLQKKQAPTVFVIFLHKIWFSKIHCLKILTTIAARFFAKWLLIKLSVVMVLYKLKVGKEKNSLEAFFKTTGFDFYSEYIIYLFIYLRMQFLWSLKSMAYWQQIFVYILVTDLPILTDQNLLTRYPV